MNLSDTAALHPQPDTGLRLCVSLVAHESPRGLTEADTLMRLLGCVQESGTLARAAQALGLSYRHAWGLLRAWAQRHGAPLINAQPGRGAQLTAEGARLLWAHRRAQAQLATVLPAIESRFRADIEPACAAHTRALRLHAPGDPALALLRQAVEHRAPELRVDLRVVARHDALDALAHARCEGAGFALAHHECIKGSPMHLLLRRKLDARAHLLVEIARDELALLTRTDTAAHSVADAARAGLRLARREPGSCARGLLERQLRAAGLSADSLQGSEDVELTDAGAAARVAAGQADWCIAPAGLAPRFGLAARALALHTRYLAIGRDALGTSAIDALRATLRAPEFRLQAHAADGADYTRAGYTATLTEALPWL